MAVAIFLTPLITPEAASPTRAKPLSITNAIIFKEAADANKLIMKQGKDKI